MASANDGIVGAIRAQSEAAARLASLRTTG
jgi:hypothetical protein